MMKIKNLLIIIAMFLCAACVAQHIIPVEKVYTYKDSEGGLMGNHNKVYIKDINNVLPKFVGTWKGTSNGISYEFVIENVTTDRDYIVEDELLLRFKITDRNGNVIENTLPLSDDNKYVMKNGYVSQTGSYVFNYIGRNYNCGQNGSFFVTVRESSSELLTVFLYVSGETSNCNTGEAVQILPTNQLDLRKQ